MPLSLDEAYQSATPQAPARGISLDEVYKDQPKPAPAASRLSTAVKGAMSTASDIGESVKEGGKEAWQNYVGLFNEYSKALKDDYHAMPEGWGPQLLQGGKLALDLGGAAFSPAESVARQGFIEPAQALVNQGSKLVQDHLAADDEYNAQARREGQTGQQYPKGIDWKVHKQDVQNTAEGLNTAIEAMGMAALGLAGGEEAGAKFKAQIKPEAVAEDAARAGHLPPEEPKAEVKAPEFKQVGITPEGKPRVRAVSPEQAQARVAEAVHTVHAESAPDIPHDSIPGQRQGLYGEWDTLHTNMAQDYDEHFRLQEQERQGGAAAPDSARSSRNLLARMIDSAPRGYVKDLLQKLSIHLADTPIHFVREILDHKGQLTDHLGEYRWSDNGSVSEVHVVHNTNSPEMTRTIVHELVHAATSRFIHAHENHPLVRELERLRLEAINRANQKEHETGAFDAHYGMQNVHEFVAEAFSNPRFQKWLAKTSRYANAMSSRLGTYFDSFAHLVARMLGVNTVNESQLLHNTMYLSKRLMEAQDRALHSGTLHTVANAPNGAPITRGMFNATARIDRLPGVRESTGRLAGYVDELIRTFNPEGLGERAKVAGAVVASRMAERAQRTAAWNHGARMRIAFWQSHPELGKQFIDLFERGAKFKNPELQKLAQWYREWGRQIAEQDREITGLRYDPRDNYLSHIFEDEKGAEEYFRQKYGKKWGDPAFIKDRSFDLYSEARDAGLTPKYTNPEDIMLARQLSSDIANMQQGIMEDLAKYELATEKEKGSKTVPPDTSLRRAPNGKWYHVDNQSYAILHNAFDTKSLWAAKGMVGDAFRGAMALKNAVVPIRLAVSLFHPLHVIHIDNAAATAMAWKNVLTGTGNVAKAVAETIKSGLLYRSMWENPRMGSRLIKVWRGDVPTKDLTEADAQALQFMTEGGFIPEMSAIYRTNAIDNFKAAVRQHSAKALWHLPWATLSAMGKPIFQVWIPNLKAASYMREVQNALKNNPGLLDDSRARQLAFRKVAKSVDNRYGEMSYDTLFWTRWVKDLAVANTLSLGWQMGFIREYGGGALDIGQFVKGGDRSRIQRVREGLLDRPAFVTAYTTTALGYGGLLTYALSGKPPQTLMDYVMPLSGEQNPDGTPQRLNTMFYTREFASLYKHMQNQGIVSGLGHLVQGKASGLIGLVGEWASGVNSFGQEIRDPDAPAYKKLEQTLAYTMLDLEPISTKAIREGATADPLKSGALSIAGFNPAPKYMNETKTQAHIKDAYGLYVAPKQTPYDRAQTKGDTNALRAAYARGDVDFGDKLDAFTENHQLSNQDRNKLVRSFKKGESADVYMFSRLSWEEQTKLLDAMTPEERETYLPHSNKKKLRKHYVAPEDRE